MTQPTTLPLLPLFPLGTVLFPGGVLPLQIFEVRYLDLISRCQRGSEPFGVVLLTAGSEVRQPGQVERFETVGTLASIELFANPQPGLMTVRCRGMQRFRIRSDAQQQHGLWSAVVEHIPPDPVVAVPAHLAHVATTLEQLRRAVHEEENQDFLHGLADPPWHDSGWVANRWAELLPVPVSVKQNLMALESPLLRLELIGDLLSQHGVANPPESPA